MNRSEAGRRETRTSLAVTALLVGPVIAVFSVLVGVHQLSLTFGIVGVVVGIILAVGGLLVALKNIKGD
ncbi:MAG: hypothetical protein Q8Q49_02795 [bacterium]|nr:hypothetical protein [bacterium]